MLTATLANHADDLLQILELQALNLRQHISDAEKSEHGFVTLHHDLVTLRQMNELGPTVVIKNNGKVVAYALTMMPECRHLLPDLYPMYALLDKLSWKGVSLRSMNYYVMGQVCVAKEFRGKGLFEAMYRYHKKVYSSQFDLFVTEISTQNHRSLRAHEKIGFITIHTHFDVIDEWAVVAWDWRETV